MSMSRGAFLKISDVTCVCGFFFVLFCFFRILKDQYILGYNCSCSNSPKEKETNIQ